MYGNSSMSEGDQDQYGFDQPKYCMLESVCEEIFDDRRDKKAAGTILVLFLILCLVAQRMYYRKQMRRISEESASYAPQQIPTATPAKQDYVRQVSSDSMAYGQVMRNSDSQQKQNNFD